MEEPLKQICQLTGARWTVRLTRLEADWELAEAYGLTRARRQALRAWLAGSGLSAWLAGALSSGRVRHRQCGAAAANLGCGLVYAFPIAMEQSLLLVGGETLDNQQQGWLRLLASQLNPPPALPDIALESTRLAEIEPSYDPVADLQQILQHLVSLVPCQAAYIALRLGEIFQVRATWQLPAAADRWEFTAAELPVLQDLLHNHRSLTTASLPDPHASLLPAAASGLNFAAWLAAPLVVGQRVTGFVAFFYKQETTISPPALARASAQVSRIALLVEYVVYSSEAAQVMQRLALVNELATILSASSDLRQVAGRLLQRLRRVFDAEQPALLLLDSENNLLREISPEPDSDPPPMPVRGSLAGDVVRNGRPLRLDGSQAERYSDVPDENHHSALAVPLKYRGRIFGVLRLVCRRARAFSRQDEQLMVMIASHLAGLIENVRLMEETQQRAGNLSLVHQMVQRVVGLTDARQIAALAAELLVAGFGNHYAAILWVAEDQALHLLGWAGEALLPQVERLTDAGAEHLLVQAWRERRVVLAQQSVQHPAASEMCAPMAETGHIFALIDVQRRGQFAFSSSDELALGALAGVLGSIIMNARRYQQLQDSLRQMRAVRGTALDIAGDLDLDLLLKRVVGRARELVQARGAALGLVDARSEIVQIVVSENPWHDETGLRVPLMAGVEGRVAALGEPLVIRDYNLWNGRLDFARLAPFRAVAGVPLKLKGQVIGVLSVYDDNPERQFLANDVQLLELLAPQVAIYIHNARLYQELQERVEVQEQAELQLVQSARLAAVGEMAAGVAHELNNPLTTITGFIELVLEEIPADLPQRTDLELVLREAHRARGVVRGLLDFSRPAESMRIRTDLNELIRDVLNLTAHLVRTSGVEMRTDLAADIPWASLDPNQIKQVLLNLIHNALQAMPAGGLLTLRSRHQERDAAHWIWFSVDDTGSGISPENLERIFEPFFSTRPQGSGTGLGLSVSYGIVKEHGGFIDVTSSLNEGSSFTIWLPVEAYG